MPSEETINIITSLATVVERYGVMLVFSIVSGMLNIMVLHMLIKGKLIPRAFYDRSLDEADRLQKAMETERRDIFAKLNLFLGGLKKTTDEEDMHT